MDTSKIIENVFDGESDFFEITHGAEKAFESNPKLPHDIENWDKNRLRSYIDKLQKKLDFYANFIFDNRKFLKDNRPEWYENFNNLWKRHNDMLEQAADIMRLKK
jgi:hypothetical protein